MGARSIVSVLCSLVLLSACGSVEELRSARLEQATEFNQRAQRAFQRGEYQAAATLYEQALQIDVAIENESGIAINTLNLARLNRILGNTDLAQRLLERLLEDKALNYAPAHLAEAAVQKALLLLQQNDIEGASLSANKAAAYCSKDCRISGVIDNVRAGIALRKNEADSALQLSERAASANGAVPLEQANSLRLMASARLLKNEPDAALKVLEQALSMDKLLGLPEKIREDLLLFAQAHEQLGQVAQAAHYRDRAARIAATALK